MRLVKTIDNGTHWIALVEQGILGWWGKGKTPAKAKTDARKRARRDIRRAASARR